MRKYYFYRVFAKYRDIVTEKLSDRVVVHVLSNVQDGITAGSPTAKRIWNEAVHPRRDALTKQVVQRTQTLLTEQIQEQREQATAYTDSVLERALDRSRHVFADIERIPVLGKRVTNQVEDAIKVIVGEVVRELFADAQRLDVERSVVVVEQAVGEALADRDRLLEQRIRQTVNESLQIAKEQVAVSD